MKLPRQ